jgi:hypothetical protein
MHKKETIICTSELEFSLTKTQNTESVDCKLAPADNSDHGKPNI